ncbi:MAG: type II toxin-antitoxin system VapC family toxin [Verrucomicrobiae bacterium]|nr:type II toxin-antitoxin system VapC family toxin [Verrucomicrobiae bacterium]
MILWDSSALVALLVDEPDTARRAEQLRADPMMATWWATPIEAEFAIQRRVRDGNGTFSSSDARLARARLMELARAWHEVNPTANLRRLAIRLIRTHPLRPPDAVQLAAAVSLANAGITDLKFASAEDRLNEAAEAENLTILP